MSDAIVPSRMLTWEVHSHPIGILESGRQEYSLRLRRVRFEGAIGYLMGPGCLAVSGDHGRSWNETPVRDQPIAAVRDCQLLSPREIICLARIQGSAGHQVLYSDD